MSPSTKHFIRHYVEMVVAMFAGMAVLGMPFGWLLGAAGSSWQELTDTAPALMFLAMATTMTLPMIGWMAVMLLRPAEYTHHHDHAALGVEAQHVSA
jgi:hypothetical protein